MPLIPTTIYGVSLLAALLVAAWAVFRRDDENSRKLIIVLALIWGITRVAMSMAYLNPFVWLFTDAVAVALLAHGGRAAKACAFLFCLVFAFDGYVAATSGALATQEQFEAAASVWEAVFYLSLLVSIGGAYGMGNRRISRFLRVGPYRVGSVQRGQAK